jgi:hypothetical protein
VVEAPLMISNMKYTNVGVNSRNSMGADRIHPKVGMIVPCTCSHGNECKSTEAADTALYALGLCEWWE